MLRALAVVAFVPLAVGIAACGDVGPSATLTRRTHGLVSSQAGLAMTLDADKDRDNATRSYYDADDTPVLDYGDAASGGEQRLIADLIRRYYGAAARGDGTTMCSLLFAPVAESLPEEQGRASRSCARAMARLVQRQRREISSEGRELRVLGTREDGNRGWALLSFGPNRPPGRMLVEREAPAWKIAQPFRSEMP